MNIFLSLTTLLLSNSLYIVRKIFFYSTYFEQNVQSCPKLFLILQFAVYSDLFEGLQIFFDKVKRFSFSLRRNKHFGFISACFTSRIVSSYEKASLEHFCCLIIVHFFVHIFFFHHLYLHIKHITIRFEYLPDIIYSKALPFVLLYRQEREQVKGCD